MSFNQNLGSLGQALKEKREDQGLSLEKISEWTKISVPILQAIESAEADKLPVYAYLRGFILTYARVLDMDEKEIEKELKKLIPKGREDSLSRVTSSSLETENLVESDLRLAPVIIAISILFIGSLVVIINIIRSYSKASVKTEQILEETVSTDVINKEKSLKPTKNNGKKAKLMKKTATGFKKEEKEVSTQNKSSSEEIPTTKKITMVGAVGTITKTEKTKDQNFIPVKKTEISSLEIVVKALGNVEFSYVVDGEEKKTAKLKKDQFEVLKGKNNIVLEVNDSDLLYIFHNEKDLGVFGTGGWKEKVFSK